MKIERFNEPIGRCEVNIRYDKPPYTCNKIAYGKIHGLPICDEHWLEAKKRSEK